jgi:diguanylate cyclase (GGDEF)-like protein
LSIRLKLSMLLICLFLSAITNLIFIFQLEIYGEEKLTWVSHTHEVIHTTEQFMSALKDAETGQRGYLITQNISYLRPYYQGLKAAKKTFATLLNLTADNAQQQEALNEISELMKLKLEELVMTIKLTQDDNQDKAFDVVAKNLGKEYMDELRAHLSVFINTEYILLEQRKAHYSENRAKITSIIAIEMVVFIGLAIYTLFFLQRNLFSPLSQLLLSAKKVESGEKLEAKDVIENNEMGRLLSTFFEMSQKIHGRERELDLLAKHDKLTGLKNRLTVSEDIEKSITDLQEKRGKLAILFLDLNLFKEVNDSLGHDIGDLVLKETAERLKVSVRSSDTVFRIGGDEFLVIVRSIKNVAEIHSIAKNILSTFSKPAHIQGKYMDISISLGVSVAPDDSTIGSELVKYADVAMYGAKRDKGSSYRLFNKNMLKRESDIVGAKR